MKLGLVLAGGGGKGGYEIGVWKYLKEIGLDKKISVISGTSVGGLNAVLMGTVDYETAEHIWLNEIENRILDKESSENKKAALFSRNGLLEIIEKFVPIKKLKKINKSIYVTCFKKEGITPKHFRLNDYEDSHIKKMLCATSAIPIAFQSETIFGNTYVDGGIKDNVPLKPLLEEKCTHALIVSLDKDFKENYTGSDIIPIIISPSTDLGNFTNGTLDFSQDRTNIRINLGYNDCKNLYSKRLKALLNLDGKMENTNDINDFIRRFDELNGEAIFRETLKILSKNPTLADLIKCNLNIEMSTVNKKLFWDVLADSKSSGWEFQQNKFSGTVRLLDELGNRRAWGSYDGMVNACKNFLKKVVSLDIEL